MAKVLSTPASVQFEVAVRPLACADEVLEWSNGALRIRVTAPAKRGRADAAVESLLAEVLGVPPERVRVVAGRGARRKCVEVENYKETDLDLRLPGRDAPALRSGSSRPAGAVAAVRPTVGQRRHDTPTRSAAALRLPVEQHLFQRPRLAVSSTRSSASTES